MEKYWDILFMFAKAFAVGGLICTVAQVVINFTKLTSGKILVFFMLAGVTLEALGLYGSLVDFAGAGATVPLTGFGYSLAKGVQKAVSEQGFLGIFTGGITATAGGVAAAVSFGLLFALLRQPRDKA